MTTICVQVGFRIAQPILRGLSTVLLCVSLGVQPTLAARFDIDALMGLLAAHPKERVGFVETRHLALLDAPLVSRGELVYSAPDRLERYTFEPHEETAILEGDRLTLIRDGRTRSLALSDYPQIALLTDTLRSILAGDLERLRDSYELYLAGAPHDWMLDLTPVDPGLIPNLRRVHLVGSEGRLERVDVIQVNGDRSSLRIDPQSP